VLAVLLAPLLGSVPAQAAATAANAIVVVGSDTANSWVADDSNDQLSFGGNSSSLLLGTQPAPGKGSSSVRFTTSPPGTPLPTTGQHALSADGPLRLEIVQRNLTSCYVEGTVDVIELAVNDEQVTSMALDWTGDCGGAPSGQVRAASSVPYGGLDVAYEHTWLDPWIGEPNAPFAMVVTGHGTQIPAITSAAVVPPASARPSFVEMYASDTCSGEALADQETCSVTVDAAPWDVTNDAATGLLRLQTSTGSSTSTLKCWLGPQQSRRGLFSPDQERVMDTRTGQGVRKGVVGPGKTVTLKVTGGSVPEVGTAAAVLNLTITGSTSGGHVTAYPAGTPRPTASSINFPKGWTGANLVTVPLGSNGSVTFFNASGSVHLVADLVGVYAKGKDWSITGHEFHPHDPTRVFDSRRDSGTRLGPGQHVSVKVDYGGEVNTRVHGIVVNLTATGTTGTGHLSAIPSAPSGPPPTSTLNYTRGLTAANMAIVPAVGGDPSAPVVVVANTGNASTHVVMDVVGYFAEVSTTDPGLRFRALPPTRVVDTRSDLGLASIGSATVKRVQAPRSVAGRDTWSLVGNLTGVVPSSNTYLTAWDVGPRPIASNLNLTKGVTRANSIWPALDTGNGFRLHNATGSVDTVVDVTGSFELFPPSPETLAGLPFPPLATGAAATAGIERTAPSAEGPLVAGTVPNAASWSR
jgi:hypothetical protein